MDESCRPGPFCEELARSMLESPRYGPRIRRTPGER